MASWIKSLVIIGLISLAWPGYSHAGMEEMAKQPMKLLSGNTVTLSDYKGKIVVVNFWATWCPPCLDEIPDLIKFQNKYGGKGVQIIGVNYMERADEKRLKEFVDLHGINYPVVYDDNDKIEKLSSALGGIYGLPVTKILDRSGKPVGSHVGGLTMEQLADFINPML
ncbi:MAG: TlpA family protein disulfide reductase [Magnetococcales bacterium]|nr:TlpA family protein disulfide reductase [Magnetococcales bacterium]